MLTKVQKRNRIITLIIILTVLALSCIFYAPINKSLKVFLLENFSIVQLRDNLLVHYISVGQGDATAINFPDGRVMLIDAGPDDSASTLSSYLTNKVFNNQTDFTIDYFILTHADADHIGGAMRILSDFDIGIVYMPIIESETNVYKNLVNYINENNINSEIISAKVELVGGVNLKIFEPLDRTSTNNTCPLIKLEFYDTSFLFTGDIDSSAESEFIRLYGDELDIDVLKVAHHGSSYSTSEEFIKATTPEYSVISVGKNSYGHPSSEVLNRLETNGVVNYRTDINGNILFLVGKDYENFILTTNYTITNLIIDYRLFVLVIDSVVLIEIVILSVRECKK